ncbi:MAG: biosynthetic-type acetolactate synthase large subunit [Epulopiscium sp.]|nr:biosynthetic-type acetolactate synthase large subunit [Candidatus Epulonipiscium sp.]
MRLTGAEIVTEVLMEQGVDTVFGYPGGTVINIYDALYAKRNEIKHILTAHEQGAAHAADGYARATGKTGVVIATSGPGATNLVTGIATAYLDSIPMVAITGNVAMDLIGSDSFQEVYIMGVTSPITKHNFMVKDIADLADTLREAFRIASSGRPGPVLVDIPKNLTVDTYEFTKKEPVVSTRHLPVDEEKVKELARLLNESKRPVLYFGGGVIASEASRELREFVSYCSLPACHTLMATGVLSSEDPLSLGMVGMHGRVSSAQAIQEADLLIALGTRFSDRVATNKKKFANNATIVQIDIDDSEIDKNVKSSSSIVGDVKEVLSCLMKYVTKVDRTPWLDAIEKWREEIDYHPQDDPTIIKPHRLIQTISDMAGEDAIVVTDVGQHQMWTAQYYKRTEPRSFITSGGLGTMGFSYGAAMGAKVGRPDRKVVQITGDGCFHMNLNEMCTAVTYNIPIITIVMNNNVLGMVRQWQDLFFDKRYAYTTLERKTDYVKLAEAFGATGYRATTIEEFRAAFAQALEKNAPCVIECLIDRNEKVLPMIPAGGSLDDIIVGN